MGMKKETVRELLVSVLIDRTEETKIRCYAAMIALRDIMQESSWKYPHAAWRYNEKLIRKKVGGEVFSEVFMTSCDYAKRFRMLYEAMSVMGAEDFFRFFLPDYIAQPAKAWAILKNVEFLYGEKLPLTILYVKQAYVNPEQYGQRRPGYITAIFRKGSELQELSDAVNKYPFNYERKKYTSAMKVVDIFRQHNAAQIPYMASVYQLVRSKLFGEKYVGEMRKLRCNVDDGAAFIRTCTGKTMDLLGTDEAINAAIPIIGRINCPTDFLEVALLNPQADDSRIEQDCLFSILIEQQYFAEDDSILIINAAPSFIVKYAQSGLMLRTMFAVDCAQVAELLECQFKTNTFCALEKLDSFGRHFDKIIFFSRDMKLETTTDILHRIRACCHDESRIYAVIPAAMVTWKDPKDSPVASLGIDRIDLFPKEAFRSAPKKKVVLHATMTPADDLVLARYRFPDTSREWLELSEKVWIKRDQLCGVCSIFDIRQKTAQAKMLGAGTRKDPKYHEFTPDIKFWYTEKTGQNAKGAVLEAYVCSLPTQKQEKRNKFARGKRLQNSVVHISTLESPKQVSSWLENELPYVKRIQSGVRQAFKGISAEALCLKTLWYIQLDTEGRRNSAVFEDERELVMSKVGLVRYGDGADFLAAMESFCDGMSVSKRLRYWEIVRNICNAVKRNGVVIRENIADKQIRELRKKDDGNIGDVKRALAKASFSLDEENRMIDYLEEKIKTRPEYLAVLIRLYTGLQPNIVSALTWGDLVKLPFEDCYQLYICKQYQNDEHSPVRFENAEDYRRVTICDALSAALLSRKKSIEQILKGNRKIAEIQLIATDAQVSGDDTSQITPRRINALSKKMIAELALPDEIVELPKGNGTVETNLGTPMCRDIFRSNFMYRTNLYCGFTDAEQRYVLGLTQASPYARNYCDFSNDFCQYSIYIKLCRWQVLHQKMKEHRDGSDLGCMLPTKTFKMSDHQATLLLEMPVNGEMRLEMESEFGLDVFASLVDKKGWS